jgi:excisionase family DNA binding protein
MRSQNNADRIAALFTELIELMNRDDLTEVPMPRSEPTPVLLTVEEAAKRLHIGRTRMFALLRSGEVDSVQIGRLRRVHPDALEEYATRLQNSTSEQRKSNDENPPH